MPPIASLKTSDLATASTAGPGTVASATDVATAASATDARDRLARLQEVTAALSAAATIDDVAEVATRLGARAVGAMGAGLWLRSRGDQLVLARSDGDFDQERLGPRPWPELRVLESGTVLWIESGEDRLRGASSVVPLRAQGRTLGVLSFRFPEGHHFDDDGRTFVETIAAQCAQALDRARLLAEAHERERQLVELAERLGRENAEAERNRARFARMFEANLIGAISWDVEGRILAANDAFLRTLHLSRADLEAGRLDWQALTPDEFRAIDEEKIRELEVTGAHAPYEKEYVRGDGARVPVLVSSAFFPDSRTEAVSFVVDLTEVKTTEAELKRLYDAERAAREQAVAAMRTRDEFLATVSHELRTPLNAVLGWIQLLRTGTLPEERQGHALRVIERNARVQEQLIADLLDVSRVITGRLRLNVHHVRVHEVVDMAVEVVRPSATERGIILNVDIDTDAPEVLGDSDRLQQVIWNLLTNAVKFTPSGGHIEVMLRTELPHVVVSVRDSGKGMAAEFLDYVFLPFRQADASFARRQKGLGLGLAITRSLVEMHAGTVEAYSEGEGKGATFVVRLPVATLRPEMTPRVPPFARATPPPMRAPTHALQDMTILVVEDEPDSRELLVSLLEQHGAKVLAAASVAEALDKLTLATPQVLLSDVGLPGEDGLSLIRKVRSLPMGETLPAIALTAFVSPADRQRAMDAGFNAHIAKPIEPEELIRVLIELVEKRP
jgi:PAS domain S-box-containing protein